MKIEIVVPKGRFWWQRERKYERNIAEGWHDLPVALRLTFLKIILSEQELIVAKIKILGLLLKIPNKLFWKIENEALMSLISQLVWLQLEPNADAILPILQHKGIKYHLPTKGFDNGTAIEFALADDYATKFATKNDERYLRLLTATLARPMPNTQLRPPLLTRAETERVAENEFSDLSIESCIVVLLYFVGVKVMISKHYGDFLFGEIEQKFSTATAHFPEFGWWSAYLQIAETAVFGNYEQVLQTNFHRICMCLIEKRKANLQMEAAYKEQNSKNNGI